MRRLSRRTLLSGVGTAAAVALAGCSGDDENDDNESPEETNSPEDTPGDGLRQRAWPQTLQNGLSFVYPLKQDASILSITRNSGERPRQFDPVEFNLTEDSTVEWILQINGVDASQDESGYQRTGLILSGSVSIDESDGVQVSGTDRGFDRYKLTAQERERITHLASNGEVVLAGRRSWIDTTLSRHNDGTETYLEANRGVGALIEQFDHTGYNVRLANGESFVESEFDGEGVDFSTVPETLAFGSRRTEEKLRIGIGARYGESVGETERSEFATLIESEFNISDVDVETAGDGQILLIEKTRPYTPPEERPETPSFPQYVGYDREENAVLFEFENGDQLPAENFDIEIEGEPYTGDWTRGQDTIGDGSVIAIDAEAIEPGDSMTLSYESESYGSAGSTTVLRRLPFRVQYDPETGQSTIEYVEGPSLSASRLTVRIGDSRTVTPWDGEVTAGDDAVVEDTDIETRVEIRYERDDGEVIDIGHGLIRPPGRFEIDYDGSESVLTVTYPEYDPSEQGGPRGYPRDQRPVPAAEYEIRVDGEPTETQLTAGGEVFEPGESVEVTDVPVGSSAAVVWVGGDEEFTMEKVDETTPDVSFEFGFDDGTVTITHAGGMDVDADLVTVEVLGPEERSIEWEGTDTIAEGDELVVEDAGEAAVVLVRYNDEVIADQHVGELRGDEGSEQERQESLLGPGTVA
jgi:hypothetical protein